MTVVSSENFRSLTWVLLEPHLLTPVSQEVWIPDRWRLAQRLLSAHMSYTKADVRCHSVETESASLCFPRELQYAVRPVKIESREEKSAVRDARSEPGFGKAEGGRSAEVRVSSVEEQQFIHFVGQRADICQSESGTCCSGSGVFSLSLLSSIISPDSVRLVDGTSLCSGRLEVKTNQSTQTWSSVCEQDFDQQDAEVVCRELGCGAPSVLQGALYGDMEPPMRTKEFQCGGHESALLDCRSSGSDRNTCSPGKAVGLTCSEPVRLVGGGSRCAGTLEVKRDGEWRPAIGYSPWTLKTSSAAFCRELDCGSAVSVGERQESSDRPVWWIRSDCAESGSALRECAESYSSSSFLNLTCSDSVRLVDGTSLCSGRLEVKTNQSTQTWSSVCEQDFDQQDAEVVCRELGCGAPSVLQGALYGDVEPPMRTKEFQCGGHESALLDCRSSGSDRNTCSPGKAVGLTCSESVRLVGGGSRCAGTLEVKHNGEWRPVIGYSPWTLKTSAAACRELDCGSAVSVEREESSYRSVWWIRSGCVESGSALRECAASDSSSSFLNLTCSDLLLQPNISVSSSVVGVSEEDQQQGFQVFWGSNFTVSCSVQPQYPGGSFQLSFTSSTSAHNTTQPAVNHSAHFLFPVAEPAHQGNYSCVYQLHVFSHNFSSESRVLSLSIMDPRPLIIRATVLLLVLLLENIVLYFYCRVRTLSLS
ncbi:scavenger receptor cysteine-rich type 1 protein M130, partial [Etheostoma spectabile]|uniref:scavenger receptor cysteine-rich type 1 protein M130 n=1 Tax=Etheostoma spectabile TaxID=54343 RepID=UPI0013AEF4DA